MSDKESTYQLELAARDAAVAQAQDPILALARDPSVDPEKLRAIIAMFNEQKERAAKERFDEEFAAMQLEFEPVKKTAKGDKGMYARLEDLQNQFDGKIHAHRFSYRFNETAGRDGGTDISIVVSGYGHSETTTKWIPLYEPDKAAQSGKPIMNSLQAEGTRSSYGYRYVYRAAFGIVIEGEDTDGTFDDGVKYGQYITLIEECEDMEELRAQRVDVYSKLDGDTRGKKLLAQVMAKKAKELQG